MEQKYTLTKKESKNLTFCVNHYLYDMVDSYSLSNFTSVLYEAFVDHHLNEHSSYQYELVSSYVYPEIENLKSHAYKLASYHYSYK